MTILLSSIVRRKAIALSSPVIAASLLASAASANVVLNEAFNDGQRLVQDLPNTSAWYGATGTAGSEVINLTQPAPGMITLDTSANGQLITYFTDSGVVSLGVGEALQLSLGFQMAGAVNQTLGVRMAVMDSSAGARVTADDQGTSHTRFANYAGYAGFFNPGGATMTLRERTGTSNALLSTASQWSTRVTNSDPVVIDDGTDYTAVFLVSRTVDGVTAAFSLSGPNITSPVTVSYSDPGSTLFAFDTFGIWVNGNAADSLSLTSVETTVIPEPSSYALAIGLVAAAILIIRRPRAGRLQPDRAINLS